MMFLSGVGAPVRTSDRSIFYYMYGFLRETKDTGIDIDTGLGRTGLDEYLSVIFPHVNDWIHDKPLSNHNSRKRPDYRSEELKLIVEFDGIPHYTSPLNIKKDIQNTAFYEKLGYKVVRIPYFIQLSNSAVKELFGVEVEEPLFDENIPSLGLHNPGNPAFLCHAGVERMKEEFKRFPKQYEVNVKALKEANDDFLTGLSLLSN